MNPFPPALLAAALLCADPLTPGVIVRNDGGWLVVAVDGDRIDVPTDRRTRVTWHLDGRVQLPVASLRRRMRIRFACTTSYAERVEAITLGPLAMEAAVEEFVAEVSGGRAWTALDDGELADVAALGSACYQARVMATEALRGRGTGALRLLIWARHHRDPETRVRAEGLLRQLGWDG